MSSASSSPVRSRETLTSRMVTAAVCPAGSRDGVTRRTQDSRYLARPAPKADSNGSAISSAPIRSRSGSGMSSPQITAAAPAVTKDLPRTVSAPSSVRMTWSAPRQGFGSGVCATIRATTCSGGCRSTIASAVGSSRCASTGTARAWMSSGMT